MAFTQACMANLRDLASLSKVINEKSDEINRVIEDVENELAKLHIGVEAWLESSPLQERRYQDFVDEKRSDDKNDYLVETYLGYARHGEGFALLVTDVLHVKTTNSWGNEKWEVQEEGTPKLLRQATRALRVKALDRLESLFDVIKKEAERTIQSIEKGKRAAEGLKSRDPENAV